MSLLFRKTCFNSFLFTSYTIHFDTWTFRYCLNSRFRTLRFSPLAVHFDSLTFHYCFNSRFRTLPFTPLAFYSDGITFRTPTEIAPACCTPSKLAFRTPTEEVRPLLTDAGHPECHTIVKHGHLLGLRHSKCETVAERSTSVLANGCIVINNSGALNGIYYIVRCCKRIILNKFLRYTVVCTTLSHRR
jgi:hypothetical protein